MLLGTAATAAGLNLSVLGLNEEPVDSTGTEETAEAPVEAAPVADTAAQPLADTQPAPEEPPLAPPDGGALVVVADTSGSAPAQYATPATQEATTSSEPATSALPVQTQQPTTQQPTTQQPATTARPTTQAPTTARPTTQAPTTARPTTQPPQTTRPPATTAPQESVEYVTDEFRGVATMQVAIHDGQRLELVSITPVDGMAYLVENQTSTQIKIKFRPRAGGEESEWEIRLVGGQPRIDKER